MKKLFVVLLAAVCLLSTLPFAAAEDPAAPVTDASELVTEPSVADVTAEDSAGEAPSEAPSEELSASEDATTQTPVSEEPPAEPPAEPTIEDGTEGSTEPTTDPTTEPAVDPTAPVLVEHVYYLPYLNAKGKPIYYNVSGFDFSGGVKKLVIHGTLNGLPVKYIRASGAPDTLDANPKLPAARGKGVTALVVEEGVLRVYPYALASLSSLRSVKLPQSLSKLAKGAFQNCAALETVNLPKSLTTVEACVFAGCKALQTLTLPAAVRSVQKRAFYKSGLTKIKIPAKCDLVSTEAFAYCKALTKVVIAAKNGFELQDGAFYGDAALATLSFPKTAYRATIGAYTFYGCKALSAVTLPTCSAELLLGEGAFCKSGLSGVKFTAYRTLLEPLAFAFCKSLQRVVFAADTQQIVLGVGAFYGDTKLQSVKLPAAVPEGAYLGDQAFYGCTALQTVTNAQQIVYIGSKAFARAALQSYTVPETLQMLATDAFKACKQLKTLRFLVTDAGLFDADGIAALVKTLPKTCTIYVRSEKIKRIFVSAGWKGKLVVEPAPAAKTDTPSYLKPFSP